MTRELTTIEKALADEMLEKLYAGLTPVCLLEPDRVEAWCRRVRERETKNE